MLLSPERNDFFDRLELERNPEKIVLLFDLPVGIEVPILQFGTAALVAIVTDTVKK